MKRALPTLAALLVGLTAGAVLAVGPRLAPTATYHVDLTNCDGGVNATLSAGDYYTAFKDEGVYLCVGDAGCASGGQWNPNNLVLRMSFLDGPISCRSDGMTGDVSLNLIAPGT